MTIFKEEEEYNDYRHYCNIEIIGNPFNIVTIVNILYLLKVRNILIVDLGSVSEQRMFKIHLNETVEANNLTNFLNKVKDLLLSDILHPIYIGNDSYGYYLFEDITEVKDILDRLN